MLVVQGWGLGAGLCGLPSAAVPAQSPPPPAGVLMCAPLRQALGEPLYRVSTGNYEYRLILRCRQEARARFSQMRKDVLEKMELLDQKHGEGSGWARGLGGWAPSSPLSELGKRRPREARYLPGVPRPRPGRALSLTQGGKPRRSAPHPASWGLAGVGLVRALGAQWGAVHNLPTWQGSCHP